MIPLQSWISYAGTSARCLQSWYCHHIHHFLRCAEAASFLSAVEVEERELEKLVLNLFLEHNAD